MCLLVFSVIGVINAAACFAGSAIVQDSAVGKPFSIEMLWISTEGAEYEVPPPLTVDS